MSRHVELTQEDEEILLLEKRMEEAEQRDRGIFEDSLEDDLEDIEDEDEVFPEDDDDGMPPLDFSFMY